MVSVYRPDLLRKAGAVSPLDDLEVKKVAMEYKKTEAQILLKFLLQQGLTVIPKSSKVSRIRENLEAAALDFHLKESIMDQLTSLDKGTMMWIFDLKLPLMGGETAANLPEYPFNKDGPDEY